MKLYYKIGIVGIIITTFLLVLPLCSASLGYVKTNDPANIRVLANCTSVNLIEVTNGNQTFIINEAMQNLGGQTFNYTFFNTSTNGIYTYSWDNPCVDCSQNNCGNEFIVNENGQADPSGIVIVAFGIVFIAILFFMTYSIVSMLAHVGKLDYDALDAGKSIGVYFALLGINVLQAYYFGNIQFKNWLDMFITIGLWTNIILPIIFFFFTLTAGQFIKKKLLTARLQKQENES